MGEMSKNDERFHMGRAGLVPCSQFVSDVGAINIDHTKALVRSIFIAPTSKDTWEPTIRIYRTIIFESMISCLFWN